LDETLIALIVSIHHEMEISNERPVMSLSYFGYFTG